jgi:hypothetical protein
MTAVVPALPSSDHWEFVQNLLHDLQAEEDRAQLAYLFGQWRLSIKAFRRVETHRMALMNPTDLDLLFHRACVTDLISFGTLIEIAASEHTDSELATYGIRMETIKAILQDLRNAFDEWHGQVSETRIGDLKERIFNAAPELNFPNPRS